MIRITATSAGTVLTTFKVEGRLAGEWVEELSRAAWQAFEAAPQLRIDLAGVTFIDQQGVAVLRALRRRGAEITGASPFVNHLVHGGSP